MQILAADVGGSSIRTALLDREGGITALRAQPHDTQPAADGASEADPEGWFQALAAGADHLLRSTPHRVGAIAVAAFTRSLVLVDAEGTPIRPAILFNDSRAALLRDLPPDHPETPQVNAFHPLARLAWLARHEPERLARAALALDPKDAINRRLTGIAASDPISAARLAAARDLLPALGLPDLLPPLRRPTTILGPVQAGLPGALGRLAGVPVLTMANDTWAAVAGLGALRPGHAYCISGTTEVLGLLHDAPAEAPGLLTVDWDGLWQIGGPSQHGGDALAWLREQGIDVAPNTGPGPPLFLPTLAGERVPHWDPALRGAFLGLARRHGPADLVRAVMQGVACNNRAVLERAEAAAGIRAPELRLGGGGARPDWAQLRADLLGRPVLVGACPEPGLLGCAIAAFAALEDRPIAALQDRLARPARRFLPDPARREAADRLHALFLQAEAAVAPLSRAFAAMG
jgi:xylulokinase